MGQFAISFLHKFTLTVVGKSEHLEIQRLITATAKKTKLFVIIYTTLFLIICIEYSLLPFFKYIYHNAFSNNHSNYTITLPYLARFPYSTDNTTSFAVTYILILVGVYVLALTLSGFDSLFFTIAMHITTMFKILKIEIDQLGLDLSAGTGRVELQAKLKRIILKHKTNLSLIEQLEDGFSFYLMVQFLTSSIVVCVVLYELTTVFGWNEDTFKTLTYLPGAILQLFLFCWYAQNITEEARMVSDHIYNIPWYLADPTVQKTMLTFMVKAQKPTGLTASKFYMVTLQTFQRSSTANSTSEKNERKLKTQKMAEGTYEYECMRAELLGLAHPSREEFEEKQKLRQETEVEEQLTEQLKEVDLQEESMQGTSGKMDELNSILTATQQKINKFKVACGSLTSLLKLRPSTPSQEPASGSEGKSINDPLDTLDTMKDLNASSDATVAKAAAQDIGTKVTSQLDKLDSLLNKADNATYSMKHQTDQMKKIAK
uniref:t-SNARE coiled-coil homology domain-containing protein n=1 Tax=Anopheles christyi TaxID=43041 RepID=A0A182K087_9DIPT